MVWGTTIHLVWLTTHYDGYGTDQSLLVCCANAEVAGNIKTEIEELMGFVGNNNGDNNGRYTFLLRKYKNFDPISCITSSNPASIDIEEIDLLFNNDPNINPRPLGKVDSTGVVENNAAITAVLDFLLLASWHSEYGWEVLWQKLGVSDPAEFLRKNGKAISEMVRNAIQNNVPIVIPKKNWCILCGYSRIPNEEALAIWG